MATEKLVEALARQIDRRSFLGKVGVGIVGGLLGIMGLPQTVTATVKEKCCNLCVSPSTSCSNCACVWCWRCPYLGMYYNCCECHRDTTNCGSGCSNVGCSYTTQAPQVATP